MAFLNKLIMSSSFQNIFKNASVTIARWFSKSSITIIDQFFWSGSNFVISFLLARWLPSEDYGGYVLSYTIFLLLYSIYSSLIIEPLLIYGVRYTGNEYNEYITVIKIFHFVVTIFVTCIGLIIVQLSNNFDPATKSNIFGLLLTLPVVFYAWLYRRFGYISSTNSSIVISSAGYFITTILGVIVANHFNALTGYTSWIIVGVSSFIAILLSKKIPNFSCISIIRNPNNLQKFLTLHWNYGKWSLVNAGVLWFSGQVIIFFIPVVLSLTEAAKFGAALNFYRPIQPLMQVFTLLLLPTFSMQYSLSNNKSVVNKKIVIVAVAVCLFVLSYGLILYTFSKPILEIVYKGKFLDIGPLLLVFAFFQSSSAIISLLSIGFKATNRIKEITKIWGFSAVIVIICLYPTLKYFGVLGATALLSASYVVAALIAISLSKKDYQSIDVT